MLLIETKRLSISVIINRRVTAPSAMDDLAPAMETQDIRKNTQQNMTAYDESVKLLNRVVARFRDPPEFREFNHAIPE
jgi:hypothetical protein